ncbi:MAG: fibronectin type III domain-containing protein [Chloroflexi bacterium]|nr:fibronectin type III domain-containing protein [Chloroflexota bacterium]MCL5952834.1 fibronectin type III domain-containing protein [Chloroflexota bacterium]
MSWISERLLLAATPLLAAVATRKKTVSKKSAKRPAASKARARPSGTPGTRKPTPVRPSGRAAERGKTGRTKAGRHPASKGGESAPSPKPPPPPPPPAPRPVAPTGRAILLAPINGQYTDSVYPKFRWLSVGGATRYQVVWSEDPNWGGTLSVLSIATEAAVPVEKPLRPNTIYYWRVRGGNDAGWGPWSPSGSFRVLEEPAA